MGRRLLLTADGKKHLREPVSERGDRLCKLAPVGVPFYLLPDTVLPAPTYPFRMLPGCWRKPCTSCVAKMFSWRISEPALFTLCHFGMIPLPALSAGQTTSVTISLCCASSFIHVFAHSLHSGSSFLTTNPHPWRGSFWEPVFLPISLASENVREGLALSRLFGSSL